MTTDYQSETVSIGEWDVLVVRDEDDQLTVWVSRRDSTFPPEPTGEGDGAPHEWWERFAKGSRR